MQTWKWKTRKNPLRLSATLTSVDDGKEKNFTICRVSTFCFPFSCLFSSALMTEMRKGRMALEK